MNKLALLEACLFTAEEPCSIKQLSRILKTSEEEIKWLLNDLKELYANEERGIKLSNIGGYKLVVKDEYLEKVSRLTSHADMSRGVLRVLSIISYYEPIKQSEIVKVIGNRTYEYIKELERRGFIKTEKKSRTKIITTTPNFEKYFGLKKQIIKKVIKSAKSDDKPGPEIHNKGDEISRRGQS